MDIEKEPGPYAHFDLLGGKISDLFNPISSYYGFPMPGFYGASYPHGDLIAVVKADDSLIQIPDFIMNEIAATAPDMECSKPPAKPNNPKNKGK
jgi:hypothetical protein